MSERSWPGTLASIALLAGCAGTPSAPDLATILPANESELSQASPAAHDEMKEGLRWIAHDAPATNAAVPLRSKHTQPDSLADSVDEPAYINAAPVLITAAPIDGPILASYVTISRLNLRSGPGRDWRILVTLPTGAEVNALGYSGQWVHVLTSRGEGWVHRDWIEKQWEVAGAETSEDSWSAARQTSPLLMGARQ